MAQSLENVESSEKTFQPNESKHSDFEGGLRDPRFYAAHSNVRQGYIFYIIYHIFWGECLLGKPEI